LLSHPWPPDIRFYLRLHPYVAQGSPQDLRRFMDLRHPQLSVIAPSSTVNSYDLMLASEKVISFGSTIGIESVYWGKPSILLGRTNYEDLNACYVPKTKEEAISMISDPRLPAKSSVCALPYACYIVNQGTPYIYFRPLSLDGGTFLGKRLTASLPARIVSALLRIWYTVTNSREPIIKISHGTH
jgi:capsule polysaccharide export protein KpsC/LpsZ